MISHVLNITCSPTHNHTRESARERERARALAREKTKTTGQWAQRTLPVCLHDTMLSSLWIVSVCRVSRDRFERAAREESMALWLDVKSNWHKPLTTSCLLNQEMSHNPISSRAHTTNESNLEQHSIQVREVLCEARG